MVYEMISGSPGSPKGILGGAKGNESSLEPEDTLGRGTKRREVPSLVISVGTVVVIGILWLALTESGIVKPVYFPSPQTLIGEFVKLVSKGYEGQSLWTEVWASLFRVLVGFAIGGTLGVVVGLAAGSLRGVRASMSPILAFFRPIPPIAFIPMVVLWFGLGNTGKIALIIYTSFVYTVVGAQGGASNVPIAYRRASASLGLSKKQEFLWVTIPGALPEVFSGLRVGLALAWAVVVAAELVGSQTGLGFMINNAALLFEMPTVFAGIVLIGLVGLALSGLLGVADRKLIHWKGRV